MTTPADNDYQTAAGRPRLRTSIAGFIDILGFSQMSLAAADLPHQQQLLERIADSIEDSRRYVREAISAGDSVAALHRLALKYFSDNLVVGCPLDADGVDPGSTIAFVIRCVQKYQLRMCMNGFFIRGALTKGLLCVSDNIIFGSALIESYQLESKTAIVPRIVVTEALEQLVADHLRALPPNKNGDGDLICRDIDGWWFVNYLQAARDANGVCWEIIAQHKDSILASLAGTKRHDVLPKFGWACRYHNVFCHWHRNAPGYRDEYRIDRVDEQSTINRISDLSSSPGS